MRWFNSILKEKNTGSEIEESYWVVKTFKNIWQEWISFLINKVIKRQKCQFYLEIKRLYFQHWLYRHDKNFPNYFIGNKNFNEEKNNGNSIKHKGKSVNSIRKSSVCTSNIDFIEMIQTFQSFLLVTKTLMRRKIRK